ncbi:MAG: glucose-6-phosphate dehydrogenase assembly protein OpcA [Candidatus Eremiobacteraeota bacterium]|nr:glucose-6-phosphate dehydrogenase assembly protein OpcA [Candidatus Eremiobacteraeota bacterium]MBV9409252.1 glucose-6-phosphate dehydrogenase assembly protein OpcA [Candidatus Eremiobacteraeota bacterium]
MRLESSTVPTSLEAIRGELSHAKLSTSTLNLIVWVDDPERREWVLERADKLGRKHPSFTLVLDNTGARQSGATITTGWHDAEHAQVTVRGERVEVDVAGATPETIVSYVAALCSATVPTLLWWTGSIEENESVFLALLPFAGTLLVDSSGEVREASEVRQLAQFHVEHPEVALRDLAWLRLGPWRDMIANFFDDPNLLSELYSIRRLRISSGSDAEACYLAGWLASRLGWSATGRDTFADGEGNIVQFERTRAGEIRRVQSVCLDSETSWYHGEVTDEEPNVVRVWVEGEHARDPRLFTLQAIDNASLLERAVLESGTDELFETALRSAGTLLG